MKMSISFSLLACLALVPSVLRAADKPLTPKAEASAVMRVMFGADGQAKLALKEDQKAKVGQVKQNWEAKIAQINQEFKARVQDLLTPDQRKKLEELQKAEPVEKTEHFRSVLSNKTERELKLTPEQKTKLTQMQKDFAPKASAAVLEARAKLVEGLSDDQKKKLDELVKTSKKGKGK